MKIENIDKFIAKNLVHLDTSERLTEDHNINITRIIGGNVHSVNIFWNLLYRIDLATPVSIIRASSIIKNYKNPDEFFEDYISALIDAFIEHQEKQGKPAEDLSAISDEINEFLSSHLAKTFGFQAHFRIISIYTSCKCLHVI